MESLKMKVQIISSDMVRPSLATPSHLRKLSLSLLDQKYTPRITPALFFYRAPDEATPVDVDRLKACLSETLTSFYPLAGRYQTGGIITCNDEGIPFIEAQVNCSLSTVISSLSSSSSIDLPSLYPPKDSLLASGIHLAIQVNVFSRGGFAIGWYHTHRAIDGISAATFFRHWAALVSQRYDVAALAQPDFNAGIMAFPRVAEDEGTVRQAFNNKDEMEEKEDGETDGKKGSWDYVLEKKYVVRSFIFKNGAMSELKAKSVSNQVSNPSRFEAVTAFLWKSILLASEQEGPSIFIIVVDLRSRSSPPLPITSIGNLIETAHVRVTNQAQLPELVTEIHGSISRMNEIASDYQGERRKEAKEGHGRDFFSGVCECKGNGYFLTSWSKTAGFSDADFGYGKPIWIIPADDVVNRDQKNIIILTEHTDSDGDGVEAWLFVGEETVKFLESDPEFLAFASPNF